MTQKLSYNFFPYIKRRIYWDTRAIFPTSASGLEQLTLTFYTHHLTFSSTLQSTAIVNIKHFLSRYLSVIVYLWKSAESMEIIQSKLIFVLSLSLCLTYALSHSTDVQYCGQSRLSSTYLIPSVWYNIDCLIDPTEIFIGKNETFIGKLNETFISKFHYKAPVEDLIGYIIVR